MNERNLATILSSASSKLPVVRDAPVVSSADLERAKFLQAETHRNFGGSLVEICNVEQAFRNYIAYNQLMIEELDNSSGPLPSDPRLAISYLELAVAYGFKKSYADSVACSRKALSLSYGIPEQRKAMNVRSLARANLALILLLQSIMDEAQSVAEAALLEREEILGVGDRTSMM